MAAITGTYAVHGVLTATTAQAVTLTEARGNITVTTRTAAEIYFTITTTVAPANAAVTGVDTYVVPAVVGASKTIGTGIDGPVGVNLISAGTPAFSVEAVGPEIVAER